MEVTGDPSTLSRKTWSILPLVTLGPSLLPVIFVRHRPSEDFSGGPKGEDIRVRYIRGRELTPVYYLISEGINVK